MGCIIFHQQVEHRYNQDTFYIQILQIHRLHNTGCNRAYLARNSSRIIHEKLYAEYTYFCAE